MTSNPPDRYKAVWLIFFTLGLGTLLPWNFFMTATLYFTNRLADPSNETAVDRSALLNITAPEQIYNITAPKQNHLQAKFNNVMTLCAMLPLLIFTCLNSFLHQRVSQKVRILGSLIAILIVFMLTAAFVKISFEPLTFFTLTMIKIVCINSFGAILQGSLFGLAGKLPASYTTPIMSGQGLAGTFAAFAMICAITSGSELEDSAFGYFITACVVILLAIVAYLILPKLKQSQSMNRKEKAKSTPERRDLLLHPAIVSLQKIKKSQSQLQEIQPKMMKRQERGEAMNSF
ncbi:equilibrative nucleoside transporter 1-like [Rhinatrema bivittatum]|uniref:equilibrative nucleoside transporter 1-like n=1 Tax=Rhinatrema bivittatum TaxID=194408 RepID=UPI00112863E4|nr:equilibrative nucleoside transporter 1-like [Rhinatrema bivittatum]